MERIKNGLKNHYKCNILLISIITSFIIGIAVFYLCSYTLQNQNIKDTSKQAWSSVHEELYLSLNKTEHGTKIVDKLKSKNIELNNIYSISRLKKITTGVLNHGERNFLETEFQIAERNYAYENLKNAILHFSLQKLGLFLLIIAIISFFIAYIRCDTANALTFILTSIKSGMTSILLSLSVIQLIYSFTKSSNNLDIITLPYLLIIVNLTLIAACIYFLIDIFKETLKYKKKNH